MVHFRHIIVNTLFKGDDDDDDDDNNIKSKSMHGQFYRDLERPPVDKERSLTWLCSSGLKGGKGEFHNSSSKPCTQHALSSDEHYESTA